MDTSLRIFSSFITLFLVEWWWGGEGLRSSAVPIVSNIGNMYDSVSLGGVTSRLTSDSGSASCRGDVREKDSGKRKVCNVARGISGNDDQGDGSEKTDVAWADESTVPRGHLVDPSSQGYTLLNMPWTRRMMIAVCVLVGERPDQDRKIACEDLSMWSRIKCHKTKLKTSAICRLTE